MDNAISTGMLIGQKQKDLKKKATDLFERVGISEEMTDKFPAQVSGGEAQRAAMVRAVINDPDVVFADEPTGALNSAGVEAVLNVLTDINNEGQSVVMVTHDIKRYRNGTRRYPRYRKEYRQAYSGELRIRGQRSRERCSGADCRR